MFTEHYDSQLFYSGPALAHRLKIGIARGWPAVAAVAPPKFTKGRDLAQTFTYVTGYAHSAGNSSRIPENLSGTLAICTVHTA